jgi:spermidine synthase
MLIPLFKQPFLVLAEPLGLRAAVLLAATVLFFPPLFLLGTISPYAIRLKTSSLDTVGRTAGNLFAISTLASVASALLTGFILIPNVGVTRLTLIIGGVLLLTAIAGMWKSRLKTAGALIVCACAITLIAYGTEEKADPSAGLIAIEQSPYAELRVVDKGDTRHLLIDGGIHSMVDTATGESYHRYTAVMNLPKYFRHEAGTMLLIGLGGGSLVKQYDQDGWKVEAVEIDENVTDIARKYFRLKPEDATIYQMDGRQFLSTTKNVYDVVLLDAFGSSAIPFHLVTAEAFGLVASHLVPDGMFAINIESKGWDDPIIGMIVATLKVTFANVVALPMAEPPDRLGNVILLASNRPLEPEREIERNETLDPDWRYGAGYAKAHAWDNRFTPDIKGVSPLTDDLNPIDLRAEEINMIARRDLHQYFGPGGKSW